MKTIEIIQEFLPNYDHRDDVARLDDLARWLDDEMTEEQAAEYGLSGLRMRDVFREFDELQDKLFDEALKNLTNAICAKQREKCAKAYAELNNNDFTNNNIIRILNAEQPKMEELLNTTVIKPYLLEQAAQIQDFQPTAEELELEALENYIDKTYFEREPDWQAYEFYRKEREYIQQLENKDTFPLDSILRKPSILELAAKTQSDEIWDELKREIKH